MSAYPPAVRDALAAFEAAVHEDERDEWDRNVIDRVIEWHASFGKPFSSNDLRRDLPAVRKLLISRRLIVAQRRGLIRAVGFERSTLRSTHGAHVRVYAPITDTKDGSL